MSSVSSRRIGFSGDRGADVLGQALRGDREAAAGDRGGGQTTASADARRAAGDVPRVDGIRPRCYMRAVQVLQT